MLTNAVLLYAWHFKALQRNGTGISVGVGSFVILTTAYTVDSINRGTPVKTPKYCSPFHRDPQSFWGIPIPGAESGSTNNVHPTSCGALIKSLQNDGSSSL